MTLAASDPRAVHASDPHRLDRACCSRSVLATWGTTPIVVLYTGHDGFARAWNKLEDGPEDDDRRCIECVGDLTGRVPRRRPRKALAGVDARQLDLFAPAAVGGRNRR